MLDELSARIPSLFEESTVQVKMQALLGGPRYYVVLAEQICNFWPGLKRALQIITANPRKRVENVKQLNRLAHSRRSSLFVYRDYVIGKKVLPSGESPAMEIEWIYDERNQVTENTFENAAITSFLRDLQRTIQKILLYFHERPFHLRTILETDSKLKGL